MRPKAYQQSLERKQRQRAAREFADAERAKANEGSPSGDEGGICNDEGKSQIRIDNKTVVLSDKSPEKISEIWQRKA